jgi:hypothetical protein
MMKRGGPVFLLISLLASTLKPLTGVVSEGGEDGEVVPDV